jgi:putative nucleotidyltransferase with HDIG domain
MNTVTFNSDANQSFEVSVSANGHQSFGYAGVFGSNVGYPTGDSCYVNLIDWQHHTIHFQMDVDTYQDMRTRYDAINLESSEYLYIWVEEDSFGQITNWRIFKSTLDLQHLYPIYQATYHFESLYQLFELVESLQTIPLRMFGRAVLSDLQLMKSFISIPASKRHHHSYPGGLLAHSLECAFIAAQNLDAIQDISKIEKEVTTVASLLHDIGKTQTIGQVQHTSMGRLLDHEQLTLLVLAEPLNQLTQYWPKGAETLQYLLMWNHKMGFCRYVGGNIIKLADQLSTSTSLRRMAFEGKPSYFHFSVIDSISKCNTCRN